MLYVAIAFIAYVFGCAVGVWIGDVDYIDKLNPDAKAISYKGKLYIQACEES
jgi:hypothetical protein